MTSEVTRAKLKNFVNGGRLASLIEDVGERRALEVFVEELQMLGITHIASDFDLTMTTVHSGGPVRLDSKAYNTVVSSLSTSFDYFASFANKRGIDLCVVTYNDSATIPSLIAKAGAPSSAAEYVGGADLVAHVLKHCNAQFLVKKVYGFYPP